mgnify:CR=1 FL=1
MKEKIDLDGKLLIAMPGIGDQNFDKSVIYMCSHSEDGAMGLVINKPSTDLKLSDLFKQLSIIPESILLTETVHIGGPVEHGNAVVMMQFKICIFSDLTLAIMLFPSASFDNALTYLDGNTHVAVILGDWEEFNAYE